MRKSTLLLSLGKGLVLFGALLPLFAYIATTFLPRKYSSGLDIDTKPLPVLAGGNGFQAPVANPRPDVPGGADQAEIFKSTKVLYPVIDELNLIGKWSAGLPEKLTKQQAFQRLSEMTKASQKTGDGVVRVTVTSIDSREAADIANTIGVVYQKLRRDDLDRQIALELTAMRSQVETQRQVVDAALIELLESANVLTSGPGSTPRSGPFSPQYQAAEKKYDEAKKLLDSLEEKYNSARMQLLIDSPTPAEIWDRATTARAPSSPDVTRIVPAAGLLGFLILIAGGFCIVTGLRLQREGTASATHSWH